MSRVASSLYDGHFQTLQPSPTVNNINEPALNIIRLNNNLVTNAWGSTKSVEEWSMVFPTAAFFEGRDIRLGEILIMVYEDPDTKRIGSVIFSALGELCTNSLTLDSRSRFFGACENLTPKMRNSNTRRALAITLLKAYSAYIQVDLNLLRTSTIPFAREWNETVAGELASEMKLVTTKSPIDIGKQLIAFGFLQQQYTDSTTLDVIYADNPEIIEQNNRLVFLMGQQLEHLFDPLTEYSPESTEALYKPPELLKNTDDDLTTSICKELFQLQESITTQLVKFLREVVIPTRIKALSGKIPEVSAAKVNKIFPPTIDEVTRVNCIFFESLKAAIPHGGYEVLKACGTTIPYFYKAYMRHESALKSFSKDQAEFLKNMEQLLPTSYSPTVISSIMKAPLNLTKIKLILQRLLTTKHWSSVEEPMAQKFYTSSVETIDSFGKDELKPYNRRVFTPTGKILTEICEGWPAMLAYGWLNRKVISVFDVKDNSDGSSGVVVLFNDYMIFAHIEEDTVDDDRMMKPKISDVLMNSLMNENPINTIPNMKVSSWTELGGLEVLAFGKNCVRVIFKNDPKSSVVLTVEDASKFAALVNKAKILGKSTPFHLFKNEKFGLSIFATAHERSVYDNENSRSKIAFFLNIDVDATLLKKYGLFAGISAKLTDDDMIRVAGLTMNGERIHHTINAVELPGYLSEEVSSLEARRRSSQNVDLFPSLAFTNRELIKRSTNVIVNHGSVVSSRKASSTLSGNNLSIGTRATSISSRRMSSLSSANSNKPLPKIVDRDSAAPSKSAKKSQKFKNRLSQMFGLKKKKKNTPSADNSKTSAKVKSRVPSASSYPSVSRPTQTQPVNTLQNKLETHRSKTSSTRLSSQNSTAPLPSPPVNLMGNVDDNVPEVSITDDYHTFESSMTPIFDEDLVPELNVETIAESSSNWVLTRDNSSVNCNLSKMTQLNKNAAPLVPQRPLRIDRPTEKFTALFGPQPADGRAAAPRTAQMVMDQPVLRELKTGNTPPVGLHTPVERNLTFRSLDDEFNSPVVRVGVNNESMEDVNRDDDVFYTPKSHRTEIETFGEDNALMEFKKGNMFDSFDAGNDLEKFGVQVGGDELEEEEEATRWSAGGSLDEINSSVTTHTKKGTDNDNIKLEREPSPNSTRTSSFKSCMNEKQLVTKVLQQTEFADGEDQDNSLKYDESFRYLVDVLGAPDVPTMLKSSDTYQTLPRSFSSHKYLADFIDSDVNISTDLYQFLKSN
ncbi:CYFA0S26e00254g1_1 [Cyberlindnera fabianii]|uniref:Bud site selection protein 3 n=1 Tax=Cyberlindnera fabianii TaxID=36022 RepID=A0A061BII4_CYBFA|nr:Bud site selection protein 3 [Cyberlindnera fabianii]CDR46801.1 CYFA0S26e00254g1_1 [Cyberlindnera fabianii]